MRRLVPSPPVLLLATLAVLLGAGCTEPVNGGGCDLCTTSAVIRGTVLDSAGIPTSAVAVIAAAFRDSCSGQHPPLAGVDPLLPQTDSLGRYQFLMRSPMGPFSGCVGVWGHSLRDSTLVADTAWATALVAFRADYPAGQPRDTVTVNLVLRRR